MNPNPEIPQHLAAHDTIMPNAGWSPDAILPESMLHPAEAIAEPVVEPVSTPAENTTEPIGHAAAQDLDAADVMDGEHAVRRIGNTLGTFSREMWWGKDRPWEKGSYLKWYFKESGWKYGENSERAKRIGAVILGGVTQVIDRSRAMIWALPPAFNHIITYSQEHHFNGYEQATASALAVGGIFAAWSYVVGKSLHVSINQFPETTKRFAKNHPATVETLRGAVNGFPNPKELTEEQYQKSDQTKETEPKEKKQRKLGRIALGIKRAIKTGSFSEKPQEGFETKPYETKERLLGKIALGLKRGLKTGFLYGTTMQVGLAKADEHTDQSVERRLRVTAVEGAGALAVAAALVSVMITNNSFGAAEDIKNFITNEKLLLGLSVGFIAYSAVAGYIGRRKLLREMPRKDQTENIETSADATNEVA